MNLRKMETAQLEMELAQHFVNADWARFDQADLLAELVKRYKKMKKKGKMPDPETADPIDREISLIICEGLGPLLGLTFVKN